MLIQDLELVLDELAPFATAESWDNVGLLVGRRSAVAHKVLVALDLTEDVVQEAVTGGYQAIVAHHPLLFVPLRRVTDGDRAGIIVSQLIAADVSAFALHTNLDGAPGGLCDLVAGELGLAEVAPLVRTPARWKKFVGFVPVDSLPKVSAACFSAGAGAIGKYRECSFSVEGQGTFLPEEGAHPAIGAVGRRESAAEVRFETVVPEHLAPAVVRAYIAAHPYEEPAFDLYPVEDLLTRSGQGRVGLLRESASVESLAETMGELLGLSQVAFSGEGNRLVDRVAVVTGSDGGLIEEAAAQAELLITGDLRYHDAERAADLGLALVSAPHFELESWALRQWAGGLAEMLGARRVQVSYSSSEVGPWRLASPGRRTKHGPREPQLFAVDRTPAAAESDEGLLVIRIDGGSRGNPGPSAIGVVVEDADGRVLEEVSARIGMTTNNVAEYQALITGLETALDRGARRVRVLSDSELLVRQMRREYKVRDQGLKELFLEAVSLARRFDHVDIKYVPREENAAADALVNRALDGGA